jgi:hypothetical protein
MISKKIFKYLFLAMLASALGLANAIIFITYNQFLSLVLSAVGQADLVPIVKKQIDISTFISIKIVALLLSCILLYIAFLFWQNKSSAFTKINFYVSVLWHDAKNLCNFSVFSKQEKVFMAICIIGVCLHSLLYIHTSALEHDECWSYNYFINKNILLSFLAPNNNHNLYTFICWFFNLLFSAKWAIRLVALFGGLGSIVFFAKILKQFGSTLIFSAGIILYSFSLPLLAYCIVGRSYSFTLLFAAIGLLCLQKILENPSRKKHFIYLGISQALGVCSNVGYLYPLVGFILFSIWYAYLHKNVRNKFIKTWLLCLIVFGIFLATPLLLLSGWQPLSTAGKALVWQIELLPKYTMYGANELIFYYTGIKNVGWVFIVSLVGFTSLLWKNKNWMYRFCILQLWLALLFYALHQTILPQRLFTYTIIFAVIILAIFIKDILYKLLEQEKRQYVFLLFIPLCIFGFRQHQLFNWSKKIDIAANKTAAYLFTKQIDTCYNLYFYPAPAIELYYTTNGKKIYQIKNNISSRNFGILDTAKHNHCMISSTEDSVTFQGYKKTTFDDCINVWE